MRYVFSVATISFLAAIFFSPASAQQPAASSVTTVQQRVTPSITTVNTDHSVTFRYTNAGAKVVTVETDAVLKPLAMQRDESGVWTATTPVLKPEHYGYSFVVDGVHMLDPLNHVLRPNLVGLSSDLLVPGTPPAPWELAAIPHGNLTRHVYTTHIAQHLPEDQEPYVVYTPPGYDPKHKDGYPVLYLLHGWSDTVEGWTAVGRAQYMLDRLLADGKIVPMVVVMPQAYGDYTFVTGGQQVWNDPAKVDENVSLFSNMLIEEILPAVGRDYAVAADRDHRAIAGLSMGGLEALTIGLTRHEMFSYVVGMSSAMHGEHFDQRFPALATGDAAKTADLKLLWVACGTEDALLTPNRDFVAWAKARGMPVTAIEIPGQHTWLVWRQNLLAAAPLLFR